MEIVRIPIDQLTPDPSNAKDHPKKQVEQIIKSIQELGNLDPIGIWGGENLIVEGHGRYLALKQLGYQEAECIRMDQLTEEERKAYALIHNQLTMNTGFIPDKLDTNLAAIGKIDMAQFGFDTSTVTGEGDVAEDDYEAEPPREPKAQLGDIYQLGRHRLMCGDSTEPEQVAALMAGTQADLLLTDPPYNVAYGANREKEKGLSSRTRENYHKDDGDGSFILNDSMSNGAFQDFLTGAMHSGKSCLKLGGVFYVWYASWMTLYLLNAMETVGLEVRQNLIWVKQAFTLGRQDYQWIHEPCLYGWKDGARHYFTNDRTQTTVIDDQMPNFKKMNKSELQALLTEIYSEKTPVDVIREERPLISDLHPTMKPLKLMGRLIQNSSRPGEKVLDLFGGSGSTMMACEQAGRDCFTMELDPRYVDVIIDRWEKFTGLKAIKIS